MTKTPSPFPKSGTGFVGFGCGFILSAVGLFFLVIPETGLGVAAIVGGAILLGLVAARFGDPFFEKLLALFSWT